MDYKNDGYIHYETLSNRVVDYIVTHLVDELLSSSSNYFNGRSRYNYTCDKLWKELHFVLLQMYI